MFNSLMTRRKFAPLFFCQFFAAFGDNFLRAALLFLIAYQVAEPTSASLIQLAGAVFMAPYFFLSSLAGEIADRYDKALHQYLAQLRQVVLESAIDYQRISIDENYEKALARFLVGRAQAKGMR